MPYAESDFILASKLDQLSKEGLLRGQPACEAASGRA